MRRTLAVAALTMVIAGSAAAPAAATFPGHNGPILFRQLDVQTGVGGPLLSAMPDGTRVHPISARPGFFSDWRADGKRIAFEFFEPDGDMQIATIRPDGTGERILTSGPGVHELPSWSPDGRRLVFDYSPKTPEAPGFQTRLWTMRSDGSHARPLAMDRPGFDVEPRYSPDGRWIAFARLRNLGADEWRSAIHVVGAHGGRAHRLTPWDEYVEHPTWSPDGRWIVFNVSPDGSIEKIRPDGSDRRSIRPATPGSGGHKPWFSPDGTRILFMCETQGTLPEPRPDHNEDICVMNADGTGEVNLTNTPGVFENWPSWGPAPSR